VSSYLLPGLSPADSVCTPKEAASGVRASDREPAAPGRANVDTVALEREVAARTAELSELARHLQSSAEAERSTLAKELHDELGGLITAAKMDMAWLSTRIGASLDPPSEEKFRSVVQMLNQAMTLKRRVVESLRPSLLDHFGLPVALRSHLDENCSRAGLEYVATLPEETLDLAPDTQLALFRVVQETLAGVLTRGTAKHIELVVEAENDGYSMLIGDDGAPFDGAMERTLVGMRHRIQSAGGRLEADTLPGGQGNRIRVYVPRSPA
jgi:signal transduction histidine kinase